MAWGTAKPQGLQVIVGTVAGADVTLTAGSDITGFTPSSPLIAPYAGGWAYNVDLAAVIVLGATPPVSLVVKLKTAGATVLDTYTVPPAQLVASAIIVVAPVLIGTTSSTLYYPTGDTPIVTFNCGTTAATLKFQSRAVFGFWPSTD